MANAKYIVFNDVIATATRKEVDMASQLHVNVTYLLTCLLTYLLTYLLAYLLTYYWWNLPIKTITKVPHNKPDIIIWDKLKKVCTIIEVSCPSDVNISSKIQEKLNNYAALLRNMQILYRNYRFEFLPIIVGALGYMPKCLFKYMEDLGFQKNEA